STLQQARVNLLPSSGDYSHSRHSYRCPFKTHSSFVPNRPGFLHRAVSKPPRPPAVASPQMIRGGGRDGSDTVLHNIGSFVWLQYRLRKAGTALSTTARAPFEPV